MDSPQSPPSEERRGTTSSVATDALSARALGRYLLCGDWSATSGALVRDTGLASDSPVMADALTRAAARWHAARASIARTLDETPADERAAALAGVLLEIRESLGTWTLARALLERHGGTPAGGALDGALIEEASSLARAWRDGVPTCRSGERHAA